MSKIGLIIEREYMSRVRKKSFVILTFLTPILLIALIAVPLLLSMVKDNTVKQVAVADHTGLYAPRLESNEQYHFVPTYGDPEIYKQAALNGDSIYALLVIAGDLNTDTGSTNLFARKQVEMELKDNINRQLEHLAREDKIASYQIPGLDTIIQQADVNVSVGTIKWDEQGGEKKSSSELAMIIGMICTIVIYIFIFAYGAMVMNGVIEEKTNRIVEIIVSSVKPFELMMGKIIGIALVGLTQVLLWVVLIAGILGIGTAYLGNTLSPEKATVLSEQMMSNPSLNMPGQTLSPQDMATLTDGASEANVKLAETLEVIKNLNLGELAIWFILFFLGGYLLYASLFAAVGGSIDNPEDAQQFTLPLTIPVLFALYAGMYSANNPDGPLAFWCSMIPFTSPIVMMVRIPFGVPFWELVLSFSLLVITFLLVAMMAAKIYRTGILMYGKKITYKELWKWLRYKS